MIAQTPAETTANITYPDSDGLPISDNTKQFRWIVTIKENLELIYAQNPNVFVAGDLLWYPVEGNNTIRQAPDVMVAILQRRGYANGRPKGDRGSYQQWREEGIAPQVVFDVSTPLNTRILSPGNRIGEMNRKLRFYEQYGVNEYYLYDPDRLDFAGWMRNGDRLESISQGEGSANEDLTDWTSPLLKIRFKLDDELEIYRPDGQSFLGFIDLDLRRQTAEQRAARLAAKLRGLGINPDDI